MANNYKVKTYSNSTTGTSQALFTASAATTIVKSVLANCDKSTPNVNAILRIKKSGGTEEMIKRQNITVQSSSYEMLYDVLPLEVGDALYAQSDDTDITWIMSWVESTTSVIGQSIDVLSDVDTTGKANGDVLTYNSTSGNWEAEASAGGGNNTFSTIAVAGQSNVVADTSADTLTLVAGTGVTLTTNASTDTVTITNSATGANAFGNVAVAGQTTVAADTTNDTLSLAAGTGISLTTDAASDTITITNTVTAPNTFGAIAVATQTTVLADSTADTLTLAAGTGITITTNDTTDTVTITNSATGANAFGNVAVAGQTTVAADTTNDTLTIAAGTGITITTNDTTDTVTITNDVTAPNTFGTIAVATQSSVVADSTTDTLTFAVAGGMAITTNHTTDTITFDSKQLDDDDVTLQGARLIEMNGESLTLFDASGDIAIFTSDSVKLNELSVGALDDATAGYIAWLEAANNGTNYVRIGAPTNLAASTTYTLPSADGTSGQVLSTNGTGGLSWATASGGTSYSTVRTQSGTTYTLALTDAGDYIQTTSTTAVTITVPLQSSVAWVADTEIYFEQNNTGQITIAGASGVTVNSSETLKSFARYSVLALKRVASDTWTLTGERALV